MKAFSLLSQIFEGVHPRTPHLAPGPYHQGGWRHAAAVDWSEHAEYGTEDGVQHLEEREDGPPAVDVCLGAVRIHFYLFFVINETFVAKLNHKNSLEFGFMSTIVETNFLFCETHPELVIVRCTHWCVSYRYKKKSL